MNIYVKAPGARVNYAHDWGAAYLDGPSIVVSEWRVEPEEEGGLAIAEEALTGAVATVTVEGGHAGAIYDLINRVELSDGEIDERAISFRVEAR